MGVYSSAVTGGLATEAVVGVTAGWSTIRAPSFATRLSVCPNHRLPILSAAFSSNS